MLSPNYVGVLGKIHARLSGSGVTWALTGGVGFALQGVPVEPHDIDVQTDEAGAYEMARLFSGFVTRNVALCGTEEIRSHFGALMVDGIKVEIMGNVQKRIEGGAWEPPVDVKHHRRFVDVQGMQVPVLSLEYEHHACMVLGRMDRAETLRKRLAEKYERLTTHGVTLRGDLIVLRPMTEGDWDVLLRWNRDPEVLYFADGADVKEYDLADVRKLYRGVSWNAFCFIIEIGGAPIGECWLQKMNLDRILKDHPGKDCRRIDLMIGEKGLWGRGIGTEVIRLLSRFGFERQQADLIFGCDVADYNARSLRAFQKAGFVVCSTIPQPTVNKVRWRHDLVLTRERHDELRATGAAGPTSI